jgi:hypothetical protein
MRYFLVFLAVVVIILMTFILIYNLSVKKKPQDKPKNIFRLLLAFIISLIAGGFGFFIIFALGEGLAEVLKNKVSDAIQGLITFGGVSIYNFIVCLFIGKFYSRSIWFAWFLINPIVWLVLFTNFNHSGGFIDLWWAWTALLIFAFLGSCIGLILSKRKSARSGK